MCFCMACRRQHRRALIVAGANLTIGVDHTINLRARVVTLIHYDFLRSHLVIRVAFMSPYKSTLLLRSYLVLNGNCSIHLRECTILLIV